MKTVCFWPCFALGPHFLQSVPKASNGAAGSRRAARAAAKERKKQDLCLQTLILLLRLTCACVEHCPNHCPRRHALGFLLFVCCCQCRWFTRRCLQASTLSPRALMKQQEQQSRLLAAAPLFIYSIHPSGTIARPLHAHALAPYPLPQITQDHQSKMLQLGTLLTVLLPVSSGE